MVGHSFGFLESYASPFEIRKKKITVVVVVTVPMLRSVKIEATVVRKFQIGNDRTLSLPLYEDDTHTPERLSEKQLF